MNKFVSVFALVALLLIVPATPPVSAQAEVVKSVFSFVSDEVIPGQELCDGEYDLIRTEVEITITELVDGNGGSHFNVHATDMLTYQNPTTGEIYVASGVRNTIINSNVTSLVFTRKLVLPGPGNNYFLTVKNKAIVNGNGELVVDNSEVTVECR